MDKQLEELKSKLDPRFHSILNSLEDELKEPIDTKKYFIEVFGNKLPDSFKAELDNITDILSPSDGYKIFCNSFNITPNPDYLNQVIDLYQFYCLVLPPIASILCPNKSHVNSIKMYLSDKPRKDPYFTLSQAISTSKIYLSIY